MSTVIAKNVQVGTSGTPAQNFTVYQPASPDGTVRVGNGNSGSVTDLLTLNSSGNLGLGVTPSAWTTFGSIFQGIGYALAGFSSGSNVQSALFCNSFFNGSNHIYRTTAAASEYLQISGQHQWFTAPSGTAGNAISFTQAMTLDASGNLGVGTTSPGVRLDANGGVRASEAAGFSWGSGNTFLYGGLTQDLFFGTNAGYAMRFYTSGAERARIDSSGNLLVGRTSALGGISFQNASETSMYRPTTTAGSSITSFWSDIGGTQTVRAFFTANGGLYNYSANNSNLSDRREKTNFAPAKSYLDTICAIPVQTYNYIDQDLEQDPGLTLGVVAQDVQAVAPELVTESNWGTEDNPKMRLSIYQTDLQYALMKALQELKAEFDAYKASHP